MDSFEINKIAGGVLAALLILMGVRILGEGLYEVEPLHKAAYSVPGLPEETAPAGGAPAADAGPSFEEALAKADPAKGKTVSAKCQTCHSIEKGGPNKIGPDLWGVVGRPVASHAGFSYSDALKKVGGNWDFMKIEHFVTSPRSFAPGTKMTFAGISNTQDRANLLAYLNTQSDSPLPIPKPAEKPAAAPAAPAGNGGEVKSDSGAAKDVIPAPAAKAPEGSGANHHDVKPEEQQETHPVH